MTNIPTFAFAAYSGTGKTTLIEKVVRALKAKGVRLAVIKHDGHKFEIDHEGKDSWRFAHAGADITMISSAEKTAYIEQGELSLEQLLAMVHGVDLILVEGYKNGTLPQIGIARKETGKGFTAELSRFIALVTDLDVETDRPVFALDDAENIANFILEKMTGDVSKTRHTVVAAARVMIDVRLFVQLKSGGDVRTLDQVAEALNMAPVRMCCRDSMTLTVCLNEEQHSVEIEAALSCGKGTDPEMEALSAVSAAALAVYDMCRKVQTEAVITDIRLLR